MPRSLETQAAEMNAKLAAARAPLFCSAGPRALQWFKAYDFVHAFSNERSGYSIGRAEAARYLGRYGVAL